MIARDCERIRGFAGPGHYRHLSRCRTTIIIFIIIISIIIMRFYDREKELALMEQLHEVPPSFLVITGRRRVGKTELIREFCNNKKSLYYYVDQNKSIGIMMEEFGRYTATVLDMPGYVRIDSPESLLEFLFSYKNPVIVVFDEFQRFLKIHPSFISQLQHFWDTQKKTSHVFFIISGSSVGMIKKIFLGGESPLFKRADNILTLRPFFPRECMQILADLGIKDPGDQLGLYLLFGGTIYYYTFLEKYRCTSFEDALDTLVLHDLAPFRKEMSDVLIEEFGREHATYHEILASLSQRENVPRKRSRTLLTSHRLHFHHISKISPIFSGSSSTRVPVTEYDRNSKMGRYIFSDNFFRFYARYIYRNMSLYQSGKYRPSQGKDPVGVERILRRCI